MHNIKRYLEVVVVFIFIVANASILLIKRGYFNIDVNRWPVVKR